LPCSVDAKALVCPDRYCAFIPQRPATNYSAADDENLSLSRRINAGYRLPNTYRFLSPPPYLQLPNQEPPHRPPSTGNMHENHTTRNRFAQHRLLVDFSPRGCTTRISVPPSPAHRPQHPPLLLTPPPTNPPAALVNGPPSAASSHLRSKSSTRTECGKA